jgi:hypothetical protein
VEEALFAKANKWKNSCATEMSVLFIDSAEGSCSNSLLSYGSLTLSLLLLDATEVEIVEGLFVVLSAVSG